MKYQVRNGQIQLPNPLPPKEQFSIFPKNITHFKDSSAKPQSRQQSQQLLTPPSNQYTLNTLRTSSGTLNSYQTLKEKPQSPQRIKKKYFKTQIANQHELLNQTKTLPVQNLFPQVTYRQGTDGNDKIYRQLMKVLQEENKNLKEQNRYLIKEYKKISTQNSRLRKDLKFSATIEELNLQIYKLKNINKVYQQQIEQLKQILLEQITTIHQKFNMFMSQQEVTLLYKDFTNSIKQSPFTDIESPNKRNNKQNCQMTSSTTTQSRLVLSDMLQITDQNNQQKSPQKTVGSFQRENLLSLSSEDQKNSEAQNIFSNYLRCAD